MQKNVKNWNIKPAFADERGSIYDVLENNDIKHVGIIISKANSIRANHYHKKATQWTYVISGKIILHTKGLNDESKTKKIEMSGGDMAEIPPSTIHAVEAVQDSVLLVITDQPRVDNGYEYDTFRIKIA